MDCSCFVLFPLNPIIPEIYTHRLVFLAVNFFLEAQPSNACISRLGTYLSQEVPNKLTKSASL